MKVKRPTKRRELKSEENYPRELQSKERNKVKTINEESYKVKRKRK